MKWNRNTKLLPVLAAVLGVVTMALRFGLYAAALDEKNLLMPGHILSVLVWVSAAAAAGVITLGIAGQKRSNWRDDNMPPSIRGALGAVVLGIAIGVTVWVQGAPVTVVEKLRSIFGLVSVPCLLYAAFCRAKGVRPFFVCHGCVCVFFALYLIAGYGTWSANPQLQDYVFAMLSCVTLALFAYQQTAMDVGMGNGRLQYAFGLLAGYLGIAAVSSADHPWLHVAGGLWALTNLSSFAAATWYRYAKKEI